MRRPLSTLLAAFLCSAIATESWAIEEATAKSIAENAAGCNESKKCQTSASIQEGKWELMVWFVYGYRENGEPILKPGGWVGFTISQAGVVLERTVGK